MEIESKRLVIQEKLGPPSTKQNEQDIEVVYKYLDIVLKFKDVCSKSEDIDVSEEQDWFSISLGFFIALGVIESTFADDEAEQTQYLDAHALACICRYTYHYWF